MLRKSLTYTVVITTIIWSVGLFAMPLSVAAVASGDLIKLACAAGAGVNDSCKAVYYLGADSKRYVFPDEKTFKTWYADFSGVQTVSSTEMSSYAIGGNVTYKPGVKLIKITTDPKVYAVSANGTLRWVTTEAIAIDLYGANWASMVQDVADSYFVNYTLGTDIAAAADYDKAAVTAAAESINVDKGLSSGGGVATGTGLTAALAADTPASAIVVQKAARVPFTTINLTASADGDAIIDSLVIERKGLAADSNFAGIILIDAATGNKINATPKTFNSSHQATVNDDITIAAGTTKKIIIAANMASTLQAGEAPALALASVVLKGTTALVGTLPITGNTMTMNATIAIATVQVGPGGTTFSDTAPPVGTTLDVGEIKIKNNSSVEKIELSEITLTQSGSVADGDIVNLKIKETGTTEDLATLAATAGKKATFKFTTPIVIDKGKDKSYTISATVENGSTRTIDFDAWYQDDILVKGQVYGFNILPDYYSNSGLTTAVTSEPRINGSSVWAVQTIGNGTLAIESADTIAANIAESTNQVMLGKYKFTVKGEAVEITSIGWRVTITQATGGLGATTTDITNLTVYDPNGKVVAGPADPNYNTSAGQSSGTVSFGTATTTDTITVPIGETVYTVKADLSSDFANNDTIWTNIYPQLITAKGSVTGNTLTTTNIQSTGSKQTATKTIKAAKLAVSISPTPAATTVIAGTQNYAFANLVFDASDSGDNIKVTQVKFTVWTTTGYPSNLANITIWDGAAQLATSNDTGSGGNMTSATGGAEATTTFTLSTPLVVTKGTTKTLTYKANIASGTAAGSILSVGYDSTSAPTAKDSAGNDATVVSSNSHGQNMTIQSSGTVTLSAATSPTDTLVAGGQAEEVLKFTVAASREDMTITQGYVDVLEVGALGGLKQISKVEIYDGTALVASGNATSTGSVDATVLVSEVSAGSWKLLAGQTKTYTVKATTRVPDYYTQVISGTTSDATSGEGVDFAVDSANLTISGVTSGEIAAGSRSGSASANNFYVFKAIPKFQLNDTLGTEKAGGTLPQGGKTAAELYKFKVTAVGGDVGLFSFVFLVNTTTATLTQSYKLYDGGTAVAATTTFVGSDTNSHYLSNNAIGGKGLIRLILTNDGTTPNGAMNDVVPLTVDSGTTKTLTLKADIVCQNIGTTCGASSGNGNVAVSLLGNSLQWTTGAGMQVAKADAQLYTWNTDSGANIIWTDYWRTYNNSSTTASATEQWWNGWRLRDTAGSLLQTTSTESTWIR